MSAAVISLIAMQAEPHIEAARRMQPLIRDRDIVRLLSTETTLIGIKAELFRMVVLDPAWVAEALAHDTQDTDRASVDQAPSVAGAVTSDGVTAAPSASRRPGAHLRQVAVALISSLIRKVRGPLGRISIKGNSAPRCASRCNT